MNLVPAAWKRARRAMFRAVVVVCSLAIVTGGMVAASVAPAHAQTVTSGGPYAITYSGGDLVASEDVAGISPSVLSGAIDTSWPKSVGLSPGASLSDLFQATWKKYSGASFPQPPGFSGGSSSVTSDGTGGSTVTIDVPGADISANQGVPDWLASVLSLAAGFLAYGVAFSSCEAFTVLAAAGSALAVGPPGAVVLTVVGTAVCNEVFSATFS